MKRELTLFVVAAFALMFAGVPARTDDRAGLHAMCWTSETLSSKVSEIKPRSRVAGARVATPRNALAKPSVIPQGLSGVIRRVKVRDGRKLVALTFDLCEQGHEIAGYDGRVVDVLRKNNVRATFFASGKWFLTHEERAAQLLTDPLFEIANHSWSHRNMKRLRGARLEREIVAAQQAYELTRQKLETRACLQPGLAKLSAVPKRMGLFRYPFGTCHPQAIKAVNGAGMLAIQWDISTGDPWRGQTDKAIVRTVMSRVKSGSIVVAHANGRGWNTWKALPTLIKRLRDDGYELVTVSELLSAGSPEIVTKCYDTRIGDTDLWAAGGTRAKAAKKIVRKRSRR